MAEVTRVITIQATIIGEKGSFQVRSTTKGAEEVFKDMFEHYTAYMYGCIPDQTLVDVKDFIREEG